MYDCSQVEEEEASLDRLCRGSNGQSQGTILERKRKNAKLIKSAHQSAGVTLSGILG